MTKKENPLLLEELSNAKSYIDALEEKISDLTDSEDKLKFVLNATSEIIIKIDRDGRFLEIIPDDSKLLYKPATETLGKTIHEVFPQETANMLFNPILKVFKTSVIENLEYKLNIEDQDVWFFATILPADSDSVLVVARNITSHKILVESSLETEQRFSSAFEYASIGMALVASDGRWLKVNQAICKLVGYTQDELLTKTFQDITHPDDLDADLNYVKQMLSGEIKTYQMEKRYYHKDGKIVWVLLSVSLVRNEKKEPQYFISQIQDISERKSTELLLNALYEISNTTYVVSDIKDLYVKIHEIVNELIPVKNIYIAIYDDRTEMLSFPYWVDEYDPQMPPKKLGKGLTEYVLSTGKGILVRSETNKALKEAGEIELIGTYSPVWLGVPLKVRSKTIGVIAVQDYENEKAFGEDELQLLTFISEQVARVIESKRNTEQIANYVEELKQLNITRDKFFSIIAHDLRTPFQFLLGLSEMLYDPDSNLAQDEKEKYTQELNTLLKNQYELLQNLLEWATMQLGKSEFMPSKLNLNEIIEDKIKLLQQNATEKEICIANEVEKNEFVSADRQMVRSILQNFITNGIKFTNRKGTIKIYSVIEDGYVKLTIEDNGVGIPEEALAKIYSLESVHTTKGTEGELGTGLGIMLCKEMIEKQGGKLCIESELNKGTKVIFTLPVYKNP